MSRSSLDAVEIVGIFIRASHQLHRFADTRLAATDVSGPRARLLQQLDGASSLRMGNVADLLGVTARTVTTIVDALEADGLIVRRPDPTDRRAVLLELSPAGRESLRDVQEIQRSVCEDILSPLDDAERQVFSDFLTRLLQHSSGK